MSGSFRAALAGLVFSAGAAASLDAAAVVVNLDFRDSGFSSNGGSNNTYNQDGFTLRTVNAGNHLDVPNGQTLAWHHGISNPVFSNTLLTTFSGGAFDFVSLEIKGNPQGLRFSASNGSIQDVAAGFEGVVGFGAGFEDIVSFTIDILGNGTAIHVVDNGVLEFGPVQAIPEPETVLLMAGGMALLAARVRRRPSRRAGASG
ncbi:MAG TPA: PEP-CTERM sorting domain-containing protein [Caldimonas sp.]|jgi:hypothetical protein|nr:PEP-CTERM sorting domain-containing protein [Caldimonas sp.]HEX2541290.1 PEP-CTERM sorting domain-containing protein [Caldimonas sp.]